MIAERPPCVHSRVHPMLFCPPTRDKQLKRLVGAGRFERPTPCAQGRCATRLRYAPTSEALLILNHFNDLRHRPGGPNWAKTGPIVAKPHHFTFSVTKPVGPSFAFRFSFCRASLFIC